MEVLVAGTPASVKAVKVLVSAAVLEFSVHCVAGKDSAITASASSSGSDSLSETGVGIAAVHAALDDAHCLGGQIWAGGGSSDNPEQFRHKYSQVQPGFIILLLAIPFQRKQPPQ
jgi:hypothetical protein